MDDEKVYAMANQMTKDVFAKAFDRLSFLLATYRMELTSDDEAIHMRAWGDDCDRVILCLSGKTLHKVVTEAYRWHRTRVRKEEQNGSQD